MEGLKNQLLDPFVLAGFLVLISSMYTFYDAFLNRNFPTFVTEDQIAETIEREFPLLVDYL